MKTFVISAAIAAASIMTTATTASAITGKFWDVTPFDAGNFGEAGQTPGNPGNDVVNNITDALAIIGFRGPDAVFTSTGLDYPQGGGANPIDADSTSLSAFLGTDAASITAPGGGAYDGTAVNVFGSIFEFTGVATFGAGDTLLNISSDDGFALFIGGSEVARFDGTRAIGTPTPYTYTNTGAAPVQEAFRLVFFEDNQVDIGLFVEVFNGGSIDPVPLPAGFLLMGSAFAALGLARRKRKAA